MNCKLVIFFLFFIFNSSSTYAQPPAATPAHLGTWKLLSQKVTDENGVTILTDSTETFQRKIFTTNHFVEIQEKKMPEYQDKKIVTAVAGGRYALLNGTCEEITEYSTADGLGISRIKYNLTVDNGRLHIIGTLDGLASGRYEEIYIKEGN